MDVQSENTKKGLESISEELYENLVFYFKYATSAYSVLCPRPNGKHLVMAISNPLTDIQGFVARDNVRQEVVVSLRGRQFDSSSWIASFIDLIALVPFICPGVKLPESAKVHSGFLLAWDSVVLEVIGIIDDQLEKYPEYTLVTTGHSLGGALALLAAVTLGQNFKDTPIRTYSYGAPRVGNKIFSDYVNATFGENAHRVVHGNDGVPTMMPRLLGYHHHGIEYWQYTHPASADTTAKCNAEGEDCNCSAAIPSRGVTLDHTNYFGIVATTPFCF